MTYSTQPAPAIRRTIRVKLLGNGLAIYAALVLALGALQLGLGADAAVVLCCVGAILVSIAPAALFGWRDMPAFLSLAIGVRYAATALFWKSGMLGRIDEGLYAPASSFNVVFVGVLAAAMAAIAAHFAWSRPQLFVERPTSGGLGQLRLVGVLLASVLLVSRAAHIDLPGSITNFLLDSFCMFPVAWLALNERQRPQSSVFSPQFLGTMAAFAFLCLAFNSRQSVLLTTVATIAFVIGFGIRVPKLLVVLAIVFGGFFASYVSPAMIEVRARNQMAGLRNSPQEMLAQTVQLTIDFINGDATPREREVNPRYNLKYLGDKSSFAARLVNVQQLDYIVALADSRGFIGMDKFVADLSKVFAVSPEESLLDVDYAMKMYGVLDAETTAHLEITGFGATYAYGGYGLVFGGVFGFYFIIFMFFRICCQNLARSVYAAFFIATQIHFITAAELTGSLLRFTHVTIWEFMVFWWCLMRRGSHGATRPALRATEQ